MKTIPIIGFIQVSLKIKKEIAGFGLDHQKNIQRLNELQNELDKEYDHAFISLVFIIIILALLIMMIGILK